ncbi:MAG: LysM peptidoglycan-binding domain-containing protein [Phycisphaeraceae bacterium]|nr:LysM peptidoglycan-binding domain-containing protein [Phycisphaeraceae bacterium]
MKNPYNVALVLTVAICLLIVGYHFLYQDNPPQGGEMVRLGQASDTSGRLTFGASPASDPSRPSPNQPGPNPLGATSTYAPGSPITPPPSGSQAQPVTPPPAPAAAVSTPPPTPAPTVTLPGGMTAVGAPTPAVRPVEPGTGLTGSGVRSTSVPADGTRPYTIKAGDTFASIAVSVYGADHYWREISQANPRVDPAKLSVGQVIRLPSLAQIHNEQQQTTTTAEPPQPAPSGVTYTVRPGDTLWSVAVQHYGDGRLWRTIFNANKKALNNNPDQLDAGTKLVIPPAPQGAR